MRPLALKTILVATDLTPAQAPAVHTALRLAKLTGGRLRIAHAIEDGETVDASEVQQQIRDAVADQTLDLDVFVKRGPPGAIVGQEARRLEADVVLLGPHRHRTGDSLGSTADRVVRTSGAPCLILPQELQLPLRRVLVPVDSSAGARGALAVALTWASALRQRKDRTRVIALHVAPDPTDPDHTHDHAADVKALEAVVEEVRAQVANIAHVDVESVLLHEAPEGEAILDYADRNDTDLIVIGTRGHSTSAAAILGSTSSAVVRNARAPVLLVPPERWVSESNSI